MEVVSPGPWSKYGGGTTKTKITDGYFGEGYRIEGRTASWNTLLAKNYLVLHSHK